MAKRLRITQIRSAVGRVKEQKATIRALGFRKIGQVVEQNDCSCIRGMINAVKHLVAVEELDGDK